MGSAQTKPANTNESKHSRPKGGSGALKHRKQLDFMPADVLSHVSRYLFPVHIAALHCIGSKRLMTLMSSNQVVTEFDMFAQVPPALLPDLMRRYPTLRTLRFRKALEPGSIDLLQLPGCLETLEILDPVHVPRFDEVETPHFTQLISLTLTLTQDSLNIDQLTQALPQHCLTLLSVSARPSLLAPSAGTVFPPSLLTLILDSGTYFADDLEVEARFPETLTRLDLKCFWGWFSGSVKSFPPRLVHLEMPRDCEVDGYKPTIENRMEMLELMPKTISTLILPCPLIDELVPFLPPRLTCLETYDHQFKKEAVALASMPETLLEWRGWMVHSPPPFMPPNLLVLRCWGFRYPFSDIQSFPPGLTHLRLGKTVREQTSLDSIYCLPRSLTRLEANFPWRPRNMSKLLKALPRGLKWLRLKCQLPFSKAKNLPPGLEHLKLDWVSPEFIEGLVHLPELRWLHCTIQQDHVNLSQLPPKLTALLLVCKNALDDASIRALPRSLRTLIIRSTEYEANAKFSARTLAFLPPFIRNLCILLPPKIDAEAILRYAPRTLLRVVPIVNKATLDYVTTDEADFMLQKHLGITVKRK